MLLRGAWTGVRFVRGRRAEHRRHRLLVRWAGAHVPELRAVVLEQPGAAAFAVGGPQRTVVVTRGIVDLLSGAELSAVLAHEHAHLAARHHRWLTAAALVAQALPMVPLLRDAPAQVGRLLEMDADELAAAQPRAAGDRERARRRRRVRGRGPVARGNGARPSGAAATGQRPRPAARTPPARAARGPPGARAPAVRITGAAAAAAAGVRAGRRGRRPSRIGRRRCSPSRGVAACAWRRPVVLRGPPVSSRSVPLLAGRRPGPGPGRRSRSCCRPGRRRTSRRRSG